MPRRAAAMAVLLTALCQGAVELKDDPPTVPPPATGSVSGTLAPAEKAAKVTAVSRATGALYVPAAFDAKTGRFTFANLPGDATYDVCVETMDGRRIEGIDLDFVDARLLRLAAARRKQLGLAPEAEHEFGGDDARDLLAYARDLKDFMEHRRVLYLQGHGRRATMLVELMRTREFYSGKGAFLWRVELWYFERRAGGWERLANQERVLRRERIAPEDWRKIDLTYWPDLSVQLDAAGKSRPVEFRIPDRSDATRGRPAATAADIKTEPHILGLEGKDKPPDTRPATMPVGKPQAGGSPDAP